jgi:hypothetical protein
VSTASDGIADRSFVTWLAKVTQDPEFMALMPWWRRQCVERALDVIGRDGVLAVPEGWDVVEKAAGDLAAVSRLVLAMQNEVASKGDLIDGRTTRHTTGGSTTGKPRGRK